MSSRRRLEQVREERGCDPRKVRHGRRARAITWTEVTTVPNRLFTIPLAAAAVAAALACAGGAGPDQFRMLSVDDVERMLGRPDVAIIDANVKETFEKHHLPGARHYKSAPFAQVLPADKEARLVFYCASPS